MKLEVTAVQNNLNLKMQNLKSVKCEKLNGILGSKSLSWESAANPAGFLTLGLNKIFILIKFATFEIIF